MTIHSLNEYGLTFSVVAISESQCSILLRARLVGSRCYGYRYPVKVKSTLIPAAVKRSYLKALDIVSAQAESEEEGSIMLGTDPLAANKETGDKQHDAVRGARTATITHSARATAVVLVAIGAGARSR